MLKQTTSAAAAMSVLAVTLAVLGAAPWALAAPAAYFTLAPCRVLDSRLTGPLLEDGALRIVAVAGSCGVPANASSIALNITAVGSTGPGHMTLFAAGEGTAGSTINFGASQTRANNAVVRLSPAGELAILPIVPGPGTVHAIVDVVGYFVDDAPPTAVDDTATVAEDAPASAVDVLANDTDSDGGLMQVASVTQPANGVVVITGGGTGLSYQPNADYCNTPPGTTLDTFTYTLAPEGSSATVMVSVTCVDDSPVAVADAATVLEDSGASAIAVLANDTDIDGGTKLVGSVTQPPNGVVVITGGGAGLTYAPGPNYCNNPPGTLLDAFTYTLSPGGSSTTVTMTVTCVNDPPTLTTNPISYATAGNTQLHVAGATLAGVASIADAQSALTKASPTDIDGPVAPTVVAASGASSNGGSFAIAANGSFTYVPPAGFTGTDSFTYQVTDTVTPASGTISIAVSQVVWYVRDTVDANNPAGGDGRSNNAFETLAAAQTASGNGHTIFVFAGDTASTPLAGGIVLKDGQRLHGEGIGLSVPGFSNIVAAGTQPKINNTVGDAVSVPATSGSRNLVEIRGLDLQASGNAVDVTASGTNAVGITISDNTLSGAGLEGIDLNAGSTGLFTATVQNNTLFSTGNGIDARTSAAGLLQVSLNSNAVTSSANGIVVDGSGGGLTHITGFANNSVSGVALGTGIAVTSATFDATPGGAFQTVLGGNTAVGASGVGNGVGTNGIVLTNVAGDLAFADLDVFADGGAALRASGTAPYTGSAGLQLAVGAGVSVLAAVGGPAVDLTTVTVSLPLLQVGSTNSASTGVSLVTVPGTFSAGATSSISNATGTDFVINGANATVTYAGTIADDVGQLVQVTNTTGGTKTFTGAITDGNDGDGTGISLTSNTGATISFQGGLQLSTGANPAYTATGGGTVNVCDENPCNPSATGPLVNTLTTTTGTALNVANTTIGANKLEFRSISANGGTNGIVLNNTGSGGLTVSGTGAAGSGGTIQNTTTRGASFTSSSNIVLRFMNFTNAATVDFPAAPTGLSLGNNTGDNAALHLETVTNATLENLTLNGSAEQGINGHNVTNFTLRDSVLSNLGNGADEDGLHFFNMLGTSLITNTSITSSGDDNVNIQNNTNLALPSGMVPVGTLTITNGSANTGVLGSGYLFGIRGTSDATITLSGVTSNNNFSGGIVADGFDTATMRISVTGSAITNNNDGVQVSANNGTSRFDINNNDFIGNDFLAVTLLKAAFSVGGVLEGAVRNNNPITIGNGRTTDAISVFQAGGGALRVAITDNVFSYAGTQRAILVQAGQDGNGTVDATITGNTIDVQLDGVGDAVAGILAQSAITGPGNVAALCADLGGAGGLGNVFSHSLGGAMAAGDIRVRQRNDGTVRLPGFGGAATDTAAVVSYLTGRNTIVSAPTASVQSTGFGGGGGCAAPTLP